MSTILFILMTLVTGGLCTITYPPLNVIDVVGSEVILQCQSNTTESRTLINWYFEQYGTNYTSTAVSGCVATEGYSVQSSSEGQCNLNISSLDGRYAGRYTCQNGNEASVAALVGVIVTGPSNLISFRTPLIEGDSVTYSALTTLSGEFYFTYQWSSVQPVCDSSRAATAEQSQASDWDLAPTTNADSSFTVKACRPEVYPVRCTLTFRIFLREPALGNATNNPTYQYLWNSNSLPVLYEPRSSDIQITGCSVPLVVGRELTCYAPANPPANYKWINPDGTETNGTSVIIDPIGRGNYTCVAWNSIGSSSKICDPSSGTNTGAQWNFKMWLTITGFITAQACHINYRSISI